MNSTPQHLGPNAASKPCSDDQQTSVHGQVGVTSDIPDLIHIEHGINDIDLPVAGFPVAKIRTTVAETLNLGPEAVAYADDLPVDESYVLRPSQKLTFIGTSGGKGIGRVWTQQQFMKLFHMTEADRQKWVEDGLPVDVMESGRSCSTKRRWMSGSVLARSLPQSLTL